MEIVHTPHAMTAWAQEQRHSGRRIGLVPTMGYLHAGHLSLVDEAKKNADAVAVSIFVNPTQFGPNEDFASYPRNAACDVALCREADVAAVFLPAPETMYAPDASVFVDEDVLCHGLCGASRPGHFKGVCTVVAKLFNIVLPDVAVFGQKDFQQAAIIRRMVRDLNFPVSIIIAPTLREPDGLAMSSRNAYLSTEERRQAVGLSRALDALMEGMPPSGTVLRHRMRDILEQHGLRVDYAEIVDAETLTPVEKISKGNVALIAAYCGTTRLIDNRVL
ncbi:MAG: pantoate--beta-alanine ligase [Kiritimatiellaeota bacterium]|nr:pantoate--beta-alanine ligase [Kiritimatiellota bacterium]